MRGKTQSGKLPGACTVRHVQCTVNSLQYTDSVECTFYSMVCSVQCSEEFTVYSVQYTVYSAECTVYSMQCTVSVLSK